MCSSDATAFLADTDLLFSFKADRNARDDVVFW